MTRVCGEGAAGTVCDGGVAATATRRLRARHRSRETPTL